MCGTYRSTSVARSPPPDRSIQPSIDPRKHHRSAANRRAPSSARVNRRAAGHQRSASVSFENGSDGAARCIIRSRKSVRASEGSGPGEDVGGQVGQAELPLPLGGSIGSSPRLVELDDPSGGFAQARLTRRGDPGLAGLHPLVAGENQRLGLGKSAYAPSAQKKAS